MNVIVSNTLRDSYKNYKVVSKLSDAVTLDGVSCLILHSFTEEDFEVGITLSELAKKGVKRFAYVSEDISLVVKMLISGLDGLIEDADFYFENEEDLDALLDDFFSSKDNNSDLSATTEIITEFLKGFANNDDKVKSPVFLEQVNDAVNALVVTNTENEVAIRDMSKATVDTFRHVSSTINAMEEQRNLLEEQLASFEQSLQNQTRSTVRVDSGTVWVFPTYNYMGKSKILYIREYAPCRYLTSFVLAYANYVNYNLAKKCKVVFIHARGQGVSKRYSQGFTCITQESEGNKSLYTNPIIATNNPKKCVMDELTHTGEPLIIIVDRLYGGDSIISGQRITRLNAVSGVSDLKRFNLSVEETLFPIIKVPNSFGTISHMMKYPHDERTRLSKYYETMKELFEQINAKVGI